MEELVKEFKSLIINLYKDSSVEEKRLLKKIVYKLNVPQVKKDEIWNEIVWLGGVLDDFEGMQE